MCNSDILTHLGLEQFKHFQIMTNSDGILSLYQMLWLLKFRKIQAPRIPTGLPKFRFSFRCQGRDYADVFESTMPKLSAYSCYTILKRIPPTNFRFFMFLHIGLLLVPSLVGIFWMTESNIIFCRCNILS